MLSWVPWRRVTGLHGVALPHGLDKIEEAQKELNGAEVSKKEILQAGVKGTSESLKGNLTKHMKSKAHSKKCVDLGVSVGLIDEQDTEESDEKQRFSYERSGYDLEESDGPDEDDNENEDDDEDSQAESVLSAAPSVTASPQHLPSRSSLQDPVSTDEDVRITDCFSGVHTDPMDVLPRALLTKMTVLSTAQSDYNRKTLSPGKARQRAARDENDTIPSVDTSRSPCHQMSVDYPESEEIL
ncbi:HIVEP1 isoform 5, partial [Pan troglodytes]